ncbi:MAG: hypothetical protein IJD80_04995, partial [Oscillospiraceae bacterium]|nr:hypothetical protein [Oscillospiraceae bacterium]
MLKKIGFNAFYAIFAVFSLWTTIAGFAYSSGKISNNIILSVFFAGLIFAAGILFYRCREISEKHYKAAVFVFFLIYFLVLTAFGSITMTVPVSDLEVLVKAAAHRLEEKSLVAYSSYFTICRNTLGNELFIILMFLPAYSMGLDIFSDKAEVWGIAVNCAMIVLTVLFMWILAKRIMKNRNMELFFLLLCAAYIPYYLWAHRYYSDTLSLAFLPLSVMLYDNSRNSTGINKIAWSVATGVSIWLGYFIRGSIIIVLVAIAIYSVFCDKKDFFKTGFVVVLSFIITMNCWNYYEYHNDWIDFSNDEKYMYPTTMWFLYGAHDEGNYSDYDVSAMKALPTYTERKAVASQMLKDYYSQYDAKSYLEFLTLKYGKTWGNGRFDAENYLNNQRHGNFTHNFLIDGMPFTALFTYVANGLHFALLIIN